MCKIVSKLKNFIPTKRRIIQLYAALLTNANLKGFTNGKIYQGEVKKVCAPGLNCYSCPGASAACPLGALQNALANSDTKLPYYIFGILILFGVIFGRWICGFLCPFGLIQDLAYKIKTPKVKKSKITRVFSYFKYILLAVFVFAMPVIYALEGAGLPLPAFCKYICPSGTLLGAGGLLINKNNELYFGMLDILFTWKVLLLLLFLLGMVFIYRFFCRFFCPLGAIYGLFNKISLLGMKIDTNKCTDCGICVNVCKMDIRKVGDSECISCGCCVSKCPTKAISYKGGKILLPKNEIDGIKTDKKKISVKQCVLAGAMAFLLIAALLYYNVFDAPAAVDVSNTETSSTDIEYGNTVGSMCYTADLELINGGTYNIENNRGKITIINFWGTWCGPCVKELKNEFPKISEEFMDTVTVVTVHTAFTETDVDIPGFIKDNFTDADYVYCKDSDGEAYCTMLGGGQAYPYTVVVDRNGVIASLIAGETSYEDLKAIIESIK